MVRPQHNLPKSLRCQRPTSLLVGFCSLWLAIAGHAAELHRIENIHFLIPGGAGGGWDRTARGTGQVLLDAGLIKSARYENMSGGGGAKGLAHVIELNDPNMLLVNSTPIVIRALKKEFPQSFRHLTPIASIIGDYSVIAVRNESDIQTLAELAHQQQLNPRKIAIGGGSIRGGTDHITAALIVKGFGSDPKTTKYIPYDAGGKAMAGLLSGEVQALSSGYGEVIDLARQGWVRILCIASEQRLTVAPQTPTCEEAGAKGAIFVNWRGFFAGPDIPAERIIAYRQLLATMYEQPQWQVLRDSNGWVDIFRPGGKFIELLEAQEQLVGNLMRELGLL